MHASATSRLASTPQWVAGAALAAVSGAAHAFEPMQVLTSMREFAEALTPAIAVFAFLAGVAILGLTFVHMVNAHRGGGPLSHGDSSLKVGAVALRMGIAAALMSFGWSLSNTITTLFAQQVPVRNALAYAPVAQMSSPVWTAAWGVIVMWVALIGAAGFMRGLILWNAAASESQQGGDHFWRGLWHIVGGAAAANIAWFFS